MEGPGMHIPVKIGKVRVIGHRLKPSPPAEAGTNALRQSGLPCADIACHQNQMLRHKVFILSCISLPAENCCVLTVMRTRILTIIIILILGVLLFSYGTNNTEQTDTVDVDALRTKAVETYASSLTETLVVVPITSPTLTVEPTSTPPDITATLETPAEIGRAS